VRQIAAATMYAGALGEAIQAIIPGVVGGGEGGSAAAATLDKLLQKVQDLCEVTQQTRETRTITVGCNACLPACLHA
jgi:hypothetical protein